MLAKLDSLIEKDGPAAKTAGALATLLYTLLGTGVVPQAQWDAVLTAAVLFSVFAPVAMRRGLLVQRAAITGEPVDADPET